MADDILFVGLDVHKKSISVATMLDKPGEACRYYGSIPNTPDALRRLCKKLQADDASLCFCYEAGPCGCGVQRSLTRLGASLSLRGRGDAGHGVIARGRLLSPVFITASAAWGGCANLGRVAVQQYVRLTCRSKRARR
jgi:hypothetical protein